MLVCSLSLGIKDAIPLHPNWRYAHSLELSILRFKMASTTQKYTTKLVGKRVLVIGGTSGVGFCVAEAALECGAHVMICGSRQSKLDNALSRLKSAYPEKSSNIRGQTCDLSEPQFLESRLEVLLQATAGGSKLDHIVFTAGPALKITPVSEASVDDILTAGHVRFLGPFVLGKVAPKYMHNDSTSSITLTGGTNSHRPVKSWTIQAAWGSGVEGMMRGLAVDLAPIRVNIIELGAVHTELFGDIPEAHLPALLQRMRDSSLLDKVGTPEDVAQAYLFTLKDHFVTGSVIKTDGGRLLKSDNGSAPRDFSRQAQLATTKQM